MLAFPAPARVVVADADEAFARELARELAGERTVDVAGWATDAHWALELARLERPDAVLLPLELPGAISILEELAAIEPRAPKVILTGGEQKIAALLAHAGSTGTSEAAGFIHRAADVSEMASLVVVAVALANAAPTNDLNGTTV